MLLASFLMGGVSSLIIMKIIEMVSKKRKNNNNNNESVVKENKVIFAGGSKKPEPISVKPGLYRVLPESELRKGKREKDSEQAMEEELDKIMKGNNNEDEL